MRAALGTAGALALAPSRSLAAAISAPRLIRHLGAEHRAPLRGRPVAGSRPSAPGSPAGTPPSSASSSGTRQRCSSMSSVRRSASARSSGRLGSSCTAGQQSLTWNRTRTRRRDVRDPAHRGVRHGRPTRVRGAAARRSRAIEAPVVRVLGIEAACARRSYAPGEADLADDPRRCPQAHASRPSTAGPSPSTRTAPTR